MPEGKSKKRLWVFVIGCFCAAVAIAGILIWRMGAAEKPLRDPFISTYKGEVMVDAVGKRLTGFWKWEGINTRQERLDSVYFHLNPRQFNGEQPLRGENWAYVLGENPRPGQYNVDYVEVMGKRVDDQGYQIKGTILKIDDVQWDQRERLDIKIGFSLKLPKNEERMSFDEHAIWLGNWVPTLAVYDEGGWQTTEYYSVGDSFYSSIADYQVQMSLPPGYHLISSGNDDLMTSKVTGNWVQYKVEGERLRDFAVAIVDPYYARLQDRVGETIVNTWFLEGDDIHAATQLHQTAVQAMHYYQESFGAYPYKEYDVVRTGGFFGGMEYPGLIFVQDTYFQNPEDKYGIVVVAHETAHQWWYAVVGNDQAREPWLDESLSEFSAMKFLHDFYPDFGPLYVEGKVRFITHPPEELEMQNGDIRRPVWEYENWEVYSYDVYNRGAVALWKLQEQVGANKMNHFLQKYYHTHQMGEVTGKDFQKAMIQYLGKESWLLFEKQISGMSSEISRG